MKTTNRQRTTAKRISETEREAQCIDLRRAGWSYPEIAEKLGYADRSGPFRVVSRAMQRVKSENANAARAMELERLDAMQRAAWAEALGQVVQADGTQACNPRLMEVLLRVSERRAKLAGLDAPEQRVVQMVEQQTIALLEKAREILNEDDFARLAEALTATTEE